MGPRAKATKDKTGRFVLAPRIYGSRDYTRTLRLLIRSVNAPSIVNPDERCPDSTRSPARGGLTQRAVDAATALPMARDAGRPFGAAAALATCTDR